MISSILKNAFFRTVVVPFLLLTLAPIFTLLLFVGLEHFNGEVLSLARALWRQPRQVASLIPLPTARSLKALFGFIAAEFALLVLVPARGYLATITPAGVRPWYKLNGVRCYFLTLGGFLLGSTEFGYGWWSGGVLYDQWGELIASGSLVGLVLSFFFYFKGLTVEPSADAGATGHGFVWDFFQGTELHPEIFGYKMKQLINCRVSMNGWALLALSFALKERELHGGQLAPGMLVSSGLLIVYLYKFFLWEDGYFGSMDIQHDRFGFYLIWGLFAWVTAVYVVPMYFLVKHAGLGLDARSAALVFVLGVASIYANWEADDQRQRVRESRGECTVWGSTPQVIEAPYKSGDGKRHTSLLLHSGWWGIARHSHYLTEIALCAFWSLPAGFTAFLPWFYVFYLTILLLDRAYRDEQRCAKKYGKAWKEYMGKVPYRVIPFIY